MNKIIHFTDGESMTVAGSVLDTVRMLEQASQTSGDEPGWFTFKHPRDPRRNILVRLDRVTYMEDAPIADGQVIDAEDDDLDYEDDLDVEDDEIHVARPRRAWEVR